MRTFVLLALLSAVGCKPTNTDVSPLVDARLRELGLGPSPSGSTSGASRGSAAPEKVTRDPVTESLRFLAKLDQLMDDFVPTTSSASDPSDVMRCVTTLDLQKNDALKAAQQRLQAKREALTKERETRLRALYALSYRIDPDWASKKRTEPAIFGCCNDDGSDCERWPAGAQSCAYEGGLWRVSVPAGPDKFVYTDSTEPPTAPPELMLRMAKAKLEPPPRFACRIEDVRTEKMTSLTAGKTPSDPFVPQGVMFTVIDCSSERRMPVIVRAIGNAPALRAGDIITVPILGTQRAEGVLLKTPGEREMRWTIDADPEAIAIEQTAQCASTQDILAAAKRK
ncbi:MAG TPA: hypothetical protein VK745_14400 [Polyangiaceae bacterium]|jgi:hypothetical protein|nr:hypothetical protein [Polyangiaceae bacterium]